MTNPDNAVGTNAAYGGRTSANAFNDDLAAYSRGVMSGWACAPSSGLTVVLGGDGSTRDVAVAEDNAGNKTTINNISGSPVSVTLDAAPASNSRIDAIVAYVDNPPQGSSTIADNYEACGLIAVAGTAASSPVAPTDGAIRSAITADGASGATAYYVVLATITIASGTTDIVAGDITAGLNAMIQARNINYVYSTSEQKVGTWIDGKVIYKKTVDCGALPNNTTKYIEHNIGNIGLIIKIEGIGYRSSDNVTFQLNNSINPRVSSPTATSINITANNEHINITTGNDRSNMVGYTTLYYTKTN